MVGDDHIAGTTPQIVEVTQNDVWTYDDILKYVILNKDIHKQDPALVMEIIQCESGYKQDATNNEAVVGVDRGLFQLNDHYHPGVDYYNPKENLDYGFKLLGRDGLRHWNWSKHCWDT